MANFRAKRNKKYQSTANNTLVWRSGRLMGFFLEGCLRSGLFYGKINNDIL